MIHSRVMDAAANDRAPERVVEIAANLDDVSAEVLGEAMDRLSAEGALDVWATPVQMKKRRPGVMVSLLSPEDRAERLAERLIELTGSFGVRMRAWDRVVLHRRWETVQTRYGAVRVKVGSLGDRDVVARPEFEDASKAAGEHGVPVREVMEAAMAAYRQGGW